MTDFRRRAYIPRPVRASHASDRASPALRHALLALGAALALLALTPRLAAPAHDHAAGGPASHACAACVVTHTPAEPTTPVLVVPAPIGSAVAAPSSTLAAAPEVRAWALPFACGPPASASPLA